ncbi:MAG: type II toxin-antitoxin system VapC family toxin [Myxococcota bacterium]|nr:type II toxin-antitoxin system VapC family toxin [Myxococcota bacterium]
MVDASLAARWYFAEEGHAAADALLHRAIDGQLELLAPDLLECELTNLLWKKVGRGECSEEMAHEVLELWDADRPRLIESKHLSRRALELALGFGHPVYDCLYVAAAVEYEAALATADRRLARAARGVVREVILASDRE